MSFIYITGIAGSGKTTIQKKLRQHSLDVYDEDEPSIGAAHNKQTNEPVSVPSASERTPEWFEQHEWRVLAKAMAELKDRAKDHLVVLCGNSANEKTARQLFDKVIYLKIDEATLRHRLAARADNDYGKTDQELQSILEQHKLMEQRYNASDPIIIDATQPIGKVIQDILAVLDHKDSSQISLSSIQTDLTIANCQISGLKARKAGSIGRIGVSFRAPGHLCHNSITIQRGYGIVVAMAEQVEIQVGNAAIDATKGWFVGAFMDESLGLRHTTDVEVKWGIHPAGEERREWVTGEARTTLGVLISGKWEMIFPDRTIALSKRGDFVMWGRGVDHKWRAIEDTVIMTIRWPSIKQY